MYIHLDTSVSFKVGKDFIHTENIVLIDKKRRIRGFYDGTEPLEVSQLIEDVQILLEQK